ncbi:MAG: bifunctional 5,10-methylenetetrahydrofolate dehydrogenase/5,10-methenyltetrahydrofolate cyclohydrolase [Firmicutes bacterium]|nr:bifunctional 5,10-methylenetetrahydrofolate dehydrogenase/5,10-methenyltetrahydrofolate cyclohydrolase [Bacillota bacterium]
MATKIIKGTDIAMGIRKEIKQQVAKLKADKKRQPGLAIVLVESPRGRTHVAQLKKRICEAAGIYCELHSLHALSSQREVIELIQKLNQNPKITGINVHPVPKHIDYHDIVSHLDPDKDVEGVSPFNVGNFLIGDKRFIPFTPRGVIKLIESTGVEIAGKRAVIVGRSQHVGLPIGFLLLELNATVSFAHSRSWYLAELTRQADILVVATGHPEMITGAMIKPGAVVIDVGSNSVGTHLVGDVEHSSAARVAGWITEVPGGVGPMTMTMLLTNLLECCK